MLRSLCAALWWTILGLASPYSAAQYPVRPVRLVVPFAPGGSTDVIARLLAHRLTEGLGQQIVVENRAGGGTNIGADHVAKSAADGYTLLMASSTQAINVSLYPRLPYDLTRDFAPVSLVASSPSMLVVHPSVPARTVKELVALAKARPGQLNYASSGSGSTAHLAGELFKLMAKIDAVHVPYKGAGPALTDLVGGQVHMMFGFTAGALPHVRAGKLRALAVTSTKRLAELPGLPTMSEAGVKDYEVSVWYGILAPAGTPQELITRLHVEIVKAVTSPQMAGRLADLGAYGVTNEPGQFADFIRVEIRKWARAVKASGAKVD